VACPGAQQHCSPRCVRWLKSPLRHQQRGFGKQDCSRTGSLETREGASPAEAAGCARRTSLSFGATQNPRGCAHREAASRLQLLARHHRCVVDAAHSAPVLKDRRGYAAHVHVLGPPPQGGRCEARPRALTCGMGSLCVAIKRARVSAASKFRSLYFEPLNRIELTRLRSTLPKGKTARAEVPPQGAAGGSTGHSNSADARLSALVHCLRGIPKQLPRAMAPFVPGFRVYPRSLVVLRPDAELATGVCLDPRSDHDSTNGATTCTKFATERPPSPQVRGSCGPTQLPSSSCVVAQSARRLRATAGFRNRIARSRGTATTPGTCG
jgi:hypothetical protein